jgi:hypothetical protein
MIQKTYIFTLFFMLISVSLFFLLSDKQILSQSEKRELASFPTFSWSSYFSGDFTSGINQYINDHFPYREKAVRFTESFRGSMGFHLKSKEKIVVVNRKDGDAKGLMDEEVDELLNGQAEDDYSGSLVIFNGRVYTLAAGSPSMSPLFAEMVNEYIDALSENKRVFSCVVLLSSAFIPSPDYKNYSFQNKRTLDSIRTALSEDVYFCDVFTAMKRYPDEVLWLGSDHHWNALGAYRGYEAFCATAGFEPVPLSAMRKLEEYPFLGSFYEMTSDVSVRDNPDTVEIYIPRGIETEAFHYGPDDFEQPQRTRVFCIQPSYTAFICGDKPLIRIITNAGTGRKAAVVKN